MQRPSQADADAALSHQRRKWFATEMAKNRHFYMQDKQLVLFTGTWNVNGRAPDPNLDITPWLFPRSRDVRQPYDIYMLGLQEVQTLSGVDAVRTDIMRGEAWRAKIESALMSDYDRIAERQLVGIMVFVYLRKNHTPFLSDVQLSYAATGFLNAMGNKGGVAARFKLYNRTVSCVACHLAAHIANVDRRNQDFTDVVRKAVFLPIDSRNSNASQSSQLDTVRDPYPQSEIKKYPTSIGENSVTNYTGLPAVAIGTTAWLGSVASVAATAFYEMSAGANPTVLNDPNAVKILDHDVVFWLGDLNYRIEAPLQTVLSWIKMEDWRSLYDADQLQRQMRSCDIFSGFKEGPLRFAPTYKLERFAEEYACDENGEVKRVPAYTDRILWRTEVDEDDPNGDVSIRLVDYSSAQVFCSDHRPVYALFKMMFGVEDNVRRRDVEHRINKDLDLRQERFKPSIQLSPTSVDFGDIFYNQPCDKYVSIRNLGSVSAFVSVSMPDDGPKWLRFDESRWGQVEIMPGKSARLAMTAFVNGNYGLANSLCLRGCSLEANIPINVEPGQVEERLQICGRYTATTLGLSLETLSMTAEPVFSLRTLHEHEKYYPGSLHAKLSDQETNKVIPGGVPHAIPKELWLLVDALLSGNGDERETRLCKYPSLFLTEAEDAHVQRVLAFVDRGEAVPEDIGTDAIGTCLLKILDNLDDSVIPQYAHKRAIEAGYTEDPDVVNGVIDLLPPLNGNVFWYLVGFLCEMPTIQRREDRGRAVAAMFGKVMLRTSDSRNTRDDKIKTSFMMAAIQHQQTFVQSYSAFMDLGNPQLHPKRLDKAGGPR